MYKLMVLAKRVMDHFLEIYRKGNIHSLFMQKIEQGMKFISLVNFMLVK